MHPEIRKAAKKCQSMHEELGWEYMFWDDEKLQALTGLPQLHEVLADPEFVRHYTDAIRLYLLHHFGGVYLDIDSYCFRPFDPLRMYLEEEGKDFLVSYESERSWGRNIANGIMIAAPATPVLSAYALHVGIKLATPNLLDRAYKVTGPWALTETRDQWESWVEPHQLILSSAAFIPLYKDEGDGLDLADVFDIAARHGSYTVQMYQGNKKNNMFKMVQEANSKIEIGNRSDSKQGDIGDSGDKAMKPSILMIVAHPDDEVLWGGELLIQEAGKVHVVVTCTQGHGTLTRLEEFNAVQKSAGFHGEFLDGKDTANPVALEGRIQGRIHTLICENNWERIITHGPEGEYGHPQHQKVHDAVFAAVEQCRHPREKFFVFEPHTSKNSTFSEAKAALAKLYASQKHVLFETFADWEELVVPFQDYDFWRARETCQRAAGSAKSVKYHACRLHQMLDFSGASTPQLALQWANLVTEKSIAG